MYITAMHPSLNGKVAIVTGASRSRGIGAQVAYELARRGAKVSEQRWERPPNCPAWYLADFLPRSL